MVADPQVFYPDEAEQPNYLVKLVASLILVVFAISITKTVLAINILFVKLLLSGAYMFTVITIILNDKKPLSISVSVSSKTLEYYYRDIFKREKYTVVDISNAGGSYKYETVGKVSGGWRLLLYNGNYFHNRVSVRESKNGFNKSQLDQIVALIHECRAGVSV